MLLILFFSALAKFLPKFGNSKTKQKKGINRSFLTLSPHPITHLLTRKRWRWWRRCPSWASARLARTTSALSSSTRPWPWLSVSFIVISKPSYLPLILYHFRSEWLREDHDYRVFEVCMHRLVAAQCASRTELHQWSGNYGFGWGQSKYQITIS